MLLKFTKGAKALAKSCSAVVKVHDTLFVGADEGVELARFRAQDEDDTYKLDALIDLRDWFDLPLPEATETRTRKGKLKQTVSEIDVEGMDFDEGSGSLWIVGSHAWKRGKPDPERSDEENLAGLGKCTADGNRFFLGRVSLREGEEGSWMLPAKPDVDDRRAALVRTSVTGSDLTDALRGDPLLAPFLQGPTPLPGKEGGLDVEGLACIGTDRLLVGLRGPVLRGLALVLELRLVEVANAGGRTNQLTLVPFGTAGRPYRRCFLDLAGNGVRDLCWAGDDLFILAGPSMDLDATPRIFRWQGARGLLTAPGVAEDLFAWEGRELTDVPLQPAPPPLEPGRDRAEGLTALGGGRYAITYDTDGGRLVDGTDLRCDVVVVKG